MQNGYIQVVCGVEAFVHNHNKFQDRSHKKQAGTCEVLKTKDLLGVTVSQIVSYVLDTISYRLPLSTSSTFSSLDSFS